MPSERGCRFRTARCTQTSFLLARARRTHTSVHGEAMAGCVWREMALRVYDSPVFLKVTEYTALSFAKIVRQPKTLVQIFLGTVAQIHKHIAPR